jgi:hypothetical protein
MYSAMLKRVEKYLSEAMSCNTLIIATLMHLFELAFGAESSEVTECLNLLKQEFQLAQNEQKRNTEKTPDPDLIVLDNAPVDQPTSLMARLAMRMKQKPAAQEDEIAAYLKANLNFKKGAIDRKATPLKWWKVSKIDLQLSPRCILY